jgi:hypothetical protein
MKTPHKPQPKPGASNALLFAELMLGYAHQLESLATDFARLERRVIADEAGEVLLNREGELLRMVQAQRADGRITDDAQFFIIAWLAEKSVEDMHDTDRELKRLNAKMRAIEKREGFVDELDEFIRGQEPADWKALEIKWCRRYQAVEEIVREGITRWLRQHGEFDMADLSVNDRAAFDSRREAGRCFIFGPFPEISADTSAGDTAITSVVQANV